MRNKLHAFKKIKTFLWRDVERVLKREYGIVYDKRMKSGKSFLFTRLAFQ